VSGDRNDELGIGGGFEPSTELDAGIDRFERLQEPDFTAVDDLSRYVQARIIELELEPRHEVPNVHDSLPAGPIAYRYAKHTRADSRPAVVRCPCRIEPRTPRPAARDRPHRHLKPPRRCAGGGFTQR
jgi:hypothetical protein